MGTPGKIHESHLLGKGSDVKSQQNLRNRISVKLSDDDGPSQIIANPIYIITNPIKLAWHI